MPKLLNLFLALDGRAPDLANLSDAEILTRFPLLGISSLVLLVAGLGCDVYLVQRYRDLRRQAAMRIDVPPWGLHQLAVVGMLYVSANLFFALAASLFAANENLAWGVALAGNLLVNISVLAGLFAYFRQRHIDLRAVLGLDRHTRTGGWTAGLIFFFAMIPPLVIVNFGSAALCAALDVVHSPQPVVELMSLTRSPLLIVLITTIAVAVAPVAEEVLFRGFAYPALKQRYGRWRGLVIVSLLFAVVHFHTPSVLPLFALGMAFGLAYELTGTLLAPIIMHSLFNTANVLMLFYVRVQG